MKEWKKFLFWKDAVRLLMLMWPNVTLIKLGSVNSSKPSISFPFQTSISINYLSHNYHFDSLFFLRNHSCCLLWPWMAQLVSSLAYGLILPNISIVLISKYKIHSSWYKILQWVEIPPSKSLTLFCFPQQMFSNFISQPSLTSSIEIIIVTFPLVFSLSSLWWYFLSREDIIQSILDQYGYLW